MMLQSSVTPSLLLLLLPLLLCPQLSSASRSKNRGADGVVAPSSAHRSREKAAAAARGRFHLRREELQCTWRAREESAATVRLQVTCEGDRKLGCAYVGSPVRCPAYQSEPRTFWKQVSRALRRLEGKLCTDARALPKAGVCKRAPRETHFRLEESLEQPRATETPRSTETTTRKSHRRPEAPRTSVTARRADSPGSTKCPGHSGHRQKAEEQCGSSWASVCAFFFSILESDECETRVPGEATAQRV